MNFGKGLSLKSQSNKYGLQNQAPSYDPAKASPLSSAAVPAQQPVTQQPAPQQATPQSEQPKQEQVPVAGSAFAAPQAFGSGLTSKTPSLYSYIQANKERSQPLAQTVASGGGTEGQYSTGESGLDAAILSRAPTSYQQNVAEGGQVWFEQRPLNYDPGDLSAYDKYRDTSGVYFGDTPEAIQGSIDVLNQAIGIKQGVSPDIAREAEYRRGLAQEALAKAIARQKTIQRAQDTNTALQNADVGTLQALLQKTFQQGLAEKAKEFVGLGNQSASDYVNSTASTQQAAGKAWSDAQQAEAAGRRDAQAKADAASAQAAAAQKAKVDGLNALAAKGRKEGYSRDKAVANANAMANTYGISLDDAYAIMRGERTAEDVLSNPKGGNRNDGVSAKDAALAAFAPVFGAANGLFGF